MGEKGRWPRGVVRSEGGHLLAGEATVGRMSTEGMCAELAFAGSVEIVLLEW